MPANAFEWFFIYAGPPAIPRDSPRFSWVLVGAMMSLCSLLALCMPEPPGPWRSVPSQEVLLCWEPMRSLFHRVMCVPSSGKAVLELSGASVKDRWLIAPVTSPLLSLGKLYRVGWSVGRDQDDNLVLERDGIKIPVYLKQNSLCVRGDIRVVMSDPTCDVRALQLHGPFLALTERFQVLSEGVRANRCNSSCLIDCATALAAHDVRFRTTLINGPQGWKLHELNAEVARLDDPESALPHQGIERLHEIITIATSARVNMLDLFPEGDIPAPAQPVPVRAESDDDDPMLPLEGLNEDRDVIEDQGAGIGRRAKTTFAGMSFWKGIMQKPTTAQLCHVSKRRFACPPMSRGGSERTCSTLSFDFAYTGRPKDPAKKLVCLVVADSHTGSRNAWALPRKGGTESMRYATAELCRYLNVLGHNEVTLKSDNEPTCLALKAAVKAYRTKLGLKTHIEAPEPGDHQSNPAEQAIEFLRQLTCTILAEYEKETKTAVGSLDPIHGWAWRHAGWMAHRFVKSHGITSFELVTGRPYNGKIISFGETCFGRIRSKVKGHPRWVRMLWLGKLTVSDAHVGVTPGGFLVSCRSVRRIPERFSDELCTVLRDMPYSQAAFLAGHVGQARAQRTPAGDDGPAVNAEVVPPEAPPPEQRLLPDDAMLSEIVPQLPRPSIAAGTPEPPTPHQAGIASADAVNEDVAMPEPSPAGVGASPSGSSSSGSSGSNQAGRSPPETPADHVAPGSSEPAPVRKKLRLMAVTKIGDQEFYHVDGESPDEEIEADLGDGDLEIADDGQEQTLDMPQSLIFPLDHGEPELSDEELARIDQIAMEYELQRLGRMKVLAQVDGPIPGHRTLTTKFVVTWRLKSFGWIRRARLVAREYHFLDPGAGGEFEPNPVPVETACNVSDVGTKSLNPGRTEYLLGLMGIKDADNGYAPLGQAHAAMIENARAIRAVCRDLKHFAKRGEASAQMLSIMLLALQMTPSSGQPDQDDDSDENTGLFHQCLMFFFTVLECFGEFLSQYPSVASAGLQVMLETTQTT
ncbi:GIP [Symbiodinium natans]|uniref:GIP protein n=1 Tax=Symbiodinium natans TaxID=878477 RepID=A0A812I8Q2_9DINO|nr:GIP [Symbiodinium natans]